MKTKITLVLMLMAYFQIFSQEARNFNKSISNSLEQTNKTLSYNFYPIKYTDGVDINIEFSKNNYGIVVEYRNFTNKGKYKSEVLNKNQTKTSLKNLDIDKDYEILLSYYDKQGNLLKLGSPELIKSRPSELIVLSETFYKEMSLWSRYNKEISMKSKLLSLQGKGISNNAIISYAQQFFKKSQVTVTDRKATLKEKLNYIFRNSKKADKSKGECDCSTLTHNANVSPGSYSNTGEFQTYTTYSEEDEEPYYHNTFIKNQGPSHHNYIYAYDQLGEYETQFSSVEGNSSLSPHFVKQSFNLVCLDNQLETPNCKCYKQVKIDYNYQVYQKTKTSVHTIFSRGALGAVEDFAAVLAINEEEGIKVLDAGRARMKGECHANWNPDWFSQLATLTSSVLEIIGDAGTDPDIVEIVADNIEEVTDEIIDLVETPVFNTSGGCGENVKDATLISGTKSFGMRSNDPTDIIMVDYSYIGARGYGGWNIRAESKSAFSLTTVVNPSYGVYQESNVNCCTDRIALWNAASMTNSPVTESSIINESAGFIGTFANWDDIEYDVFNNPILQQFPNSNGGYLVQDIICDTEGGVIDEEKNSCYSVIYNQENLIVKSSCNKNQKVDIKELKIYDFHGNLINAYKNSRINLSSLKGLYILNITLKNGKLISRKMIF